MMCTLQRLVYEFAVLKPLNKLTVRGIIPMVDNQVSQCRLLAVSSKHAGKRIDALLSSSLGTLLENDTLGIATALSERATHLYLWSNCA